MNKSTASVQGLSTTGLLGIVFVVLKLTHIINWSWWFVLLPFWWWIPLIILVFVIAFIAISVSKLIKSKEKP